LKDDEDLNVIEVLLKEFHEKTGSVIAKSLLDTWPQPADKFVKVRKKYYPQVTRSFKCSVVR